MQRKRSSKHTKANGYSYVRLTETRWVKFTLFVSRSRFTWLISTSGAGTTRVFNFSKWFLDVIKKKDTSVTKLNFLFFFSTARVNFEDSTSPCNWIWTVEPWILSRTLYTHVQFYSWLKNVKRSRESNEFSRRNEKMPSVRRIRRSVGKIFFNKMKKYPSSTIRERNALRSGVPTS